MTEEQHKQLVKAINNVSSSINWLIFWFIVISIITIRPINKADLKDIFETTKIKVEISTKDKQ